MNKNNLDKQSQDYKEGTRLLIVLCLIGVMFLSLSCYLTYIEIIAKDRFMDNAFNQRQWKKEESTLRGDILDRNGEVLADSEMTDDGQVRNYKYGSLYAHIIGYNSKIYGKSQIELAYNKNLAGLTELSGLADITAKFQDEKIGDSVQLTVSNNLQKTASNMLGKRNGAVVAIVPKTGEILCMVSNPTYNPSSESLQKNWDSLASSDNSPFVSRATNGLYSPGSIFKTIMLCAAYDNGLDDMEFNDKGSVEIGGKEFENEKRKAYGNIDLPRAYEVSSNVAFMELGQKLGEETIKEYMKKFEIGSQLDFELPLEKSRFDYNSSLSKPDLAALSIGQGKLLVTPMQMAIMTATVANDGIMMKPYIVKKVTNSTGIDVESEKSKIITRAVSATTASYVKDCMVGVVQNGTGRNAAISGITVGGKTGTAENEVDGKEHTWFIGFAPADDPQIAVAVMLEYSSGSGGGNAAPIARELFRQWLK